MTTQISNLPEKVYKDFATNVEFYDPFYVTETERIPSQTELSFSPPSYLSELDELFQKNQRISFAGFEPPEGYYSQYRRFFKNQLIPHVDLESVLEKFSTAVEALQLTFQGQLRSKNTIIDFLEESFELETLLKEISSLIYRYCKG